MATPAFLVLLLLAVCTAAAPPQEDKYQSPYDNADVDAVLQNDAKVKSILECLLSDSGDVCSPEDKQNRDTLPEALATDCAKCSDKQRQDMAKFFAHVSQKYPEHFKQLAAKYDPTGEHFKKFSSGRALAA